MSLDEDPGQFDTLVGIVSRLRAPDGCPWDREQTHGSLRGNLLEECYEVLQTIDEKDSRKLREELGDLLLQVVLHAQIAKDTGEFELRDVVSSITSKLVRRHPHVFGELKVATSAEVTHNWEVLKRGERAADASILSGVPKHMPALSRSQEMQRRVARVGFDWKDLEGVIDKVCEEAGELKRADTPERQDEEFGDLLFTLANVARRMGVDLESALRRANDKFFRRFAAMETACRERGVNIGDLSFDEQNTLWEEAKQRLAGP